MFENKVLRRRFGPKRDEVTGVWRELHNEELNDLYSSPNIFRVIKSRMGWAHHVARMGDIIGAYRVLEGNLRERDHLEYLGVWEDNIKMELQEVGVGCGNWMELAQDRERWQALVNTVMNLLVPKMRGISFLAAEPVSFSRRTLFHGVSK